MLKALVHLQVRLASRDRGATAVEYALMVTFIALIVIVGVKAFGTALLGRFNTASTSI